jgi:hypothetical protein
MPPIRRHDQRRSIGLRAALAATGLACACLAQAAPAAPAQGNGLTREEEAILCLDLKAIASLKADTATLEDMSARVQRMQDMVAEMRTLIEAMPAGSGDTAVVPAVPVPPPAPKPAPVAVKPPLPAPAEENLPMLPLAGAGVVVALLVLLLLRRRRKPNGQAEAALLDAPETRMDLPVPEAAPLASVFAPAAPPVAKPAVAAVAASPAAPVQAAVKPAYVPPPPPVQAPPPDLDPLPFTTEAPATTAPQTDLPAAEPAAAMAGTFTATELPEIDQALELADVMVAMGLTQGATDTLLDQIRANPRRALYHWLKLLDIYKTSGNKDDFEKSASDLRRNFNIQADDWNAEKGSAERSIEDYGHLCTRIQELWSRPGCTDYLARLLEDNRGGARLGFPLAVAEEILFLIEIQRNRD